MLSEKILTGILFCSMSCLSFATQQIPDELIFGEYAVESYNNKQIKIFQTHTAEGFSYIKEKNNFIPLGRKTLQELLQENKLPVPDESASRIFSTCTGSYRKYKLTWVMSKENKLYLHIVDFDPCRRPYAEILNKNTSEVYRTQQVFYYDPPVFANWFSGKIYTTDKWTHDSGEREVKNNILEIEKGIVVKKWLCPSKLIYDAFDFSKFQNEQCKEIDI